MYERLQAADSDNDFCMVTSGDGDTCSKAHLHPHTQNATACHRGSFSHFCHNTATKSSLVLKLQLLDWSRSTSRMEEIDKAKIKKIT